MTNVQIIDAHLHYLAPEPEAADMVEQLDLMLLNVCVANPGWRKARDHYQKLQQQNPARYAWCTTFDLPGEDRSGYAQGVIAELDRDFAAVRRVARARVDGARVRQAPLVRAVEADDGRGGARSGRP